MVDVRKDRGPNLPVTASVGGKCSQEHTDRINMSNEVDRVMEEGEAVVEDLVVRSQRGKLRDKSTTRMSRPGNPVTLSGPRRPPAGKGRVY